MAMAGVPSTTSPECVFTNVPLSLMANGQGLDFDPEVPTGPSAKTLQIDSIH